MKEAYEKPDVVSEEIFERTALSCIGFSAALMPTGATANYVPMTKESSESCSQSFS
jgi:hypothetical protein